MNQEGSQPLTTILLVDDEENILRSLRRVLRNQPYRLLVANGGDAALALLEQERVDLVISDARMPGMDGATLLAQVQQRWPYSMRILLTGYADVSSIINAINHGQIYRYISKPWDDEELMLSIRQALAFQDSQRDRLRLEPLFREQTQLLQERNAGLEQRVELQAAELAQAADMLDRAYAELRKSYVTATEVFANLVNLRLSKETQTNAEVAVLVKAYSEQQGLEGGLASDLSMAAALYNIGKLTWDDSLLSTPSELLSQESSTRYRHYPVMGENLLMALEPVQEAARLIRHHQERWDGKGFPDSLEGSDIPFGSRLLRLAVDFVELQEGMLLDRRLSRDEALLFMRTHSGRLYDPELCARFIDFCTSMTLDSAFADATAIALDTRRLEPGMVLARSLWAESGVLLLDEGKHLSCSLIDKLTAYEASEGAHYTLYIRLPSATAAT